jgi:hypothetical protein
VRCAARSSASSATRASTTRRLPHRAARRARHRSGRCRLRRQRHERPRCRWASSACPSSSLTRTRRAARGRVRHHRTGWPGCGARGLRPHPRRDRRPSMTSPSGSGPAAPRGPLLPPRPHRRRDRGERHARRELRPGVVDAGASVVLLDVAEPSDDRMAQVRCARPTGPDVSAVVCDVRDDASVAAARPARGHARSGHRSRQLRRRSTRSRADRALRSTARSRRRRRRTSRDARREPAGRRALLPGLRWRHGRARAGAIVNVASHYGIVAPDQRLYASLREQARRVLQARGLHDVEGRHHRADPLPRRLLGRAGRARQHAQPRWGEAGQDARFVAAYASRVPMGRMARADEYDGAVVFLLSDARRT